MKNFLLRYASCSPLARRHRRKRMSLPSSRARRCASWWELESAPATTSMPGCLRATWPHIFRVSRPSSCRTSRARAVLR